MEHLSIKQINNSYLQVDTSPSVHRELSEFFKFRVPGYQFMPAYKARMWDGFLRLYHSMDGSVYRGLLHYIKVFCDSRQYTFDLDPNIIQEDVWTLEDTKKQVKSLLLPVTPRDYQESAITHAIRQRRALLLSPTGSGKSLMIYGLTRHYAKKTLIIVPTISLVSQMVSDFREYSKRDKKFAVIS